MKVLKWGIRGNDRLEKEEGKVWKVEYLAHINEKGAEQSLKEHIRF